jgi:hypothetical protein
MVEIPYSDPIALFATLKDTLLSDTPPDSSKDLHTATIAPTIKHRAVQ